MYFPSIMQVVSFVNDVDAMVFIYLSVVVSFRMTARLRNFCNKKYGKNKYVVVKVLFDVTTKVFLLETFSQVHHTYFFIFL